MVDFFSVQSAEVIALTHKRPLRIHAKPVERAEPRSMVPYGLLQTDMDNGAARAVPPSCASSFHTSYSPTHTIDNIADQQTLGGLGKGDINKKSIRRISVLHTAPFPVFVYQCNNPVHHCQWFWPTNPSSSVRSSRLRTKLWLRFELPARDPLRLALLALSGAPSGGGG